MRRVFWVSVSICIVFGSECSLCAQSEGAVQGMAFEYGSGTPTESEDDEGATPVGPIAERVPSHFTQNLTIGYDLRRHDREQWVGLQFNIENLTNNVYKVSQESVFSPGEYFNPRFFTGSLKVHFR